VVAPSLGVVVMLLTQWRGIFVVLTLYGVLTLIWSALRMPETLSEQKSLMRSPLRGPRVINRAPAGPHRHSPSGPQPSPRGHLNPN
jgi:DHA1 family bicyclomycin/chloramphenicol resistance-like MFS transporter